MPFSATTDYLADPVQSTSTSSSLLKDANELLRCAEKYRLPIRILSTEGFGNFNAQGAVPSSGDASEFLGRCISAVTRGSRLQLLLWGESDLVVTPSVKTVVSSLSQFNTKRRGVSPLFECRVTNSNTDRERVPSFILVGNPKAKHHGLYGLLIEESISMNPNCSSRNTLKEITTTPSRLQSKQSEYFDSVWSCMNTNRKIRQNTFNHSDREYAR